MAIFEVFPKTMKNHNIAKLNVKIQKILKLKSDTSTNNIGKWESSWLVKREAGWSGNLKRESLYRAGYVRSSKYIQDNPFSFELIPSLLK